MIKVALNWNSALAGTVGGAILAVGTVYGLLDRGLLPRAAEDHAIHDYLMAHPDILIAMTNKLQAEQDRKAADQQQAAVKKLGMGAFFDPKLAFITGPANAKTTFVEFFDYNCPYCRASNAAVESFYQAHKADARFAFIEFPIKGEASVETARLAIAARQQPDKYLAFHFAMMAEPDLMTPKAALAIAQKIGLDVQKLQQDAKDASITTVIARANALAEAAGIDGTPAFVIDGHMLEGQLSSSRLAQLIKAGG